MGFYQDKVVVGLILAITLIMFLQVSARELEETPTTSKESGVHKDQFGGFPGGGFGGYPGWGGGYPRWGGGYPRWGGGGYPRWGGGGGYPRWGGGYPGGGWGTGGGYPFTGN